MKRGFLLGKFYPPHKGHHHLIREAAKQVDQLDVLLMYASHESISGEDRIQALEYNHLFEWNVSFYSVLDDVPIDYDNPDIWDQHLALINKAVPGGYHYVFSSEEYGEELARRMGAEHISIDLPRSNVDISGTAIRRDVAAHWDYLEEGAREILAKRVVVLGAESTGTTTLSKALAEEYGADWVPEYGRQYVEENPGHVWCSPDFMYIGLRQQEMIDGQASNAKAPLVICDTDARATAVFHHRYMDLAKYKPLEKLIKERCKPDLYILTSPIGVPFEQDGTRDGEEHRMWMHAAMNIRVAGDGHPVTLVRGTHEQRMEQAMTAIDGILKWQFAPSLDER